MSKQRIEYVLLDGSILPVDNETERRRVIDEIVRRVRDGESLGQFLFDGQRLNTTRRGLAAKRGRERAGKIRAVGTTANR